MSMQGEKIVIVDDEPDILEFLQAMLEDEGYTVITTDKSDYIEQMQDHNRPDLILLDMLLSGKDGREIARWLKSQEATRTVPIIMLSAHPSAEKEARAAGADDFLAKPFEMDDLLAKVKQYI